MRLLITGASSGIGRELAYLMRDQAKLVLMARRAKELQQVAKETGAIAICGDVGNFSDCERLVEAAQGEGELCLVCAAGSAYFADLVTQTPESIEAQIRSNLLGSIYAAKAAVPKMLESREGQIINILSIAGSVPFSGCSGYGSAKAGALMFTKVLSAEYRQHGIRCTALSPGAVNTPIWEGQSFKPDPDQMMTPRAIAETIRDLLFLPKDRSVDELTIMPPHGIL